MNYYDRWAYRDHWLRQRNEQIEEHSGLKWCHHDVGTDHIEMLEKYLELPEFHGRAPPYHELVEAEFLGISIQIHSGGMYGRERVWWFVAEQEDERLVAVIRSRYKPLIVCRATSKRFATRVLVAGKFAADSALYNEIEI